MSGSEDSGGDPRRQALLIPPGGGRFYDMGGMQSRFYADEAETAAEYSISEWHLAPGTPGPGPHAHAREDDVFYVLDGVITFWLDGERIDAPAGSFLRVPTGVTHDFANLGTVPARFLNIFIPGGFERDMPAIVDWFAKNARPRKNKNDGGPGGRAVPIEPAG